MVIFENSLVTIIEAIYYYQLEIDFNEKNSIIFFSLIRVVKKKYILRINKHII